MNSRAVIHAPCMGGAPPKGNVSSCRAIFLDRDGVINVDHGHVHSAEETVWVDGIFDLVRHAISAGFVPVVITNQAGVGKGYYTLNQFLHYSQWMHDQFASRDAPLAATYYCPHHHQAAVERYKADCDYRKPNPGMLIAAARDMGVRLSESIFIGNKMTDIEAGNAAGVGWSVLLAERENVPPVVHTANTIMEVIPMLDCKPNKKTSHAEAP